MSLSTIEARFQENLRGLLPGGGSAHVVVAFSGGLDSTVLLHLLRFARLDIDVRLTAAHFDHRMRDDSGEDAAWTARLSEEWGVDCEVGVADRPLRGEAAAREARYAFLRRVAASRAADTIATAHHADDQAETVLFRILRGTGLHGLAGIPARSDSGVIRPLLPFWQEELRDYAERHGLEWRTDLTNETLGPVRNRLRLRIIPEIESSVAPDARRRLVELAGLARETEAALRGAVEQAIAASTRAEGDAALLSRTTLKQYDPAIRSRVVRSVLSRHGIGLSRAGTRSAIEFITGSHSGRELQLPGGGRIRIEFDEARIEKVAAAHPEDAIISITPVERDAEVSTYLRLGGRRYRVELRHVSESTAEPVEGAIWRETIPTSELHFPLQLRGRLPGDRVQTPAGTKSLKKLMIERRIPLTERKSRPVLVDAEGRVLWIAGVTTPERTSGPALLVSIHDA
jgi:tRNA(Ile)-lysidine synthase